MPELPEVETMRRGILPVVGSRIVSVSFTDNGYRPIRVLPSRPSFRRRVAGRQIEAIDRLGKRLVLRLSGARAVVVEPRMTGLMLLAHPPDTEHLRVGWHLDTARYPELWFWDRRGLGTIQSLAAHDLSRQLGPHRLGPDALELTLATLRARLQSSRREIKVALLDQQAVAGIGNLYASEILHRARIDPRNRCDDLNSSQWRRLWLAMTAVLEAAIECEGSTLADGTYRNALNQKGSYQSHHRVYARANEQCLQCRREAVVRIVQAQRATFFCPRCQPASSRRPKVPRC